jgi:DNA-binding transcriptional LysR family regulator
LRVPVATLSRKVADLEALLGAQLLTRTTRKLVPTDAGLAYAAAARRILGELQEAEREAQGEFSKPSGDLVLTAPLMFGRLHVLPILADFMSQFPDVNVRLVLGDRNLPLVEEHIDIAVRIGALPDSSLMATRVGTMRTVTCGSPLLLKRYGHPQTPDEIGAIPCILTDLQILSKGWRLRDPAPGAPILVPLAPRLVASAEPAVDAALRGVGLVNLLLYQVHEALAAGKLIRVLEAYEPEPAPIHLIHAGHGQMPLKTRCFLDFAVPRLREAVAKID